MSKFAKALAMVAAVAVPTLAYAADPPGASQAVGIDGFVSTDSDHSSIAKAGLSFDLRRDGPDRYLGVRVEQATFDFRGPASADQQRGYVRAGNVAGHWTWALQAGSDGHQLLGSASVHDDSALRKEAFVERDYVETRQGLALGLVSTFVGAAIDLPADRNNVLTVVAGVQQFSGDNVRLHLRANAVHVVDEAIGLSVQVRARYFHDSVPREYDYYSPRYYAQILPLLQLRRFSGGWRYLIAGGYGLQRDDSTKWRGARFANLSLSSPSTRTTWGEAALLYSQVPNTGGLAGYDYLQATLGLRHAF